MHDNREIQNILVTGAAGNIGSALAGKLVQRGTYHVVGFDNLSTGSRGKLPPPSGRFRFIKGNVNDYGEISSVFFANRFDYVFHLAAVVGVQRTLANPLQVLQDIDGIRNILALSKSCGVKRVFYTSSSEVYGEPVSLPQHEETTPLNSRLPYAIVKNVGEAYLKSYHAEHGLDYTVFRLFNTYGPNQSEDFVIPRFVDLALKAAPITVYGDGRQTRTFCYVDDTIDTMVICLEGHHYVNDTINVGSSVELAVLDIAKQVVALAKSKSKIQHLPALKEGDMTRRLPDTSKMMKVLQRPLVPVEEGIARLIRHLAAPGGGPRKPA